MSWHADARLRPELVNMPPEIIEQILTVTPLVKGSFIEFIREADPFWTHKSLSQTCTSLSEPSQRTLLSKITLHPHRLQDFAGDLLISSSCAKFQSLIRVLTINPASSGRSTVDDLRVLGFILSQLTSLTELRIVNAASLSIFDKDAQQRCGPLRDSLEAASFPNLTLVGVYGRELRILPSRSLEHLTLDFSLEDHHKLADVEVPASPSPVSARKITIRNLVCADTKQSDIEGSRRCTLATRSRASVQRDEEEAVRRLFALLGKPQHLLLERCRIYASLFDCMVEMPAGQFIQILELDNIVNRYASRHPGGPESPVCHETPFSLESLSSLRILRLGAIDVTLLQRIPPHLQSLHVLTVNAFGAMDWLKNHVTLAIASRQPPLPPGCKLAVHHGVATPLADGPKDIIEMTQYPLPMLTADTQPYGGEAWRDRDELRAGDPVSGIERVTLVASKATEMDALLNKGGIDASGPFTRAASRALPVAEGKSEGWLWPDSDSDSDFDYDYPYSEYEEYEQEYNSYDGDDGYDGYDS